ncbi:MAG: hypothetical protein JXD21_01640 [Candidatus Omnitrophica bacterium]|nr:hypothetical protein [Candidatus Omnitrophota bacterium]
MKNNRSVQKAGSLCIACFLFLGGLFSSATPPVKIKKNTKGGYSFYVRNRPFVVKGVVYNPTPVCKGYDYSFFSDPAKPWLTDGKLMKKMGVNAVRIYSVPVAEIDQVKEFINDMYKKFGIYTIVSDWLGLWEVPGPNYSDQAFRAMVKERVLKIVGELKDSPGVLMWILGNENNYTFSGKIGFWTSPEIEAIETPYNQVLKRAEIYYSLVNEIALEIKKIDSRHPVALGNGEISMLNAAAKTCPDVDVLAVLSYRGKRFGNLFENIRYTFDRPVILAEFGCDSYDSLNNVPGEGIQAEYLGLQWRDIFSNTVPGGNPQGNCLGGVIFEWTDEWWKHNEGYSEGWCYHDTEAGWSEGAYYFDIRAPNNMNMNEEWFGIVKIDPQEEKGINPRIPKESYRVLSELWNMSYRALAEEISSSSKK